MLSYSFTYFFAFVQYAMIYRKFLLIAVFLGYEIFRLVLPYNENGSLQLLLQGVVNYCNKKMQLLKIFIF